MPLSLGLADVWSSHPAEAQEAVRAVPWFARLACRLLQERALGAESDWHAYLALVPDTVDGSPLCDATMLRALDRYPPLAREAAELLASVAAVHAQLSSSPGGRAALAGAGEPAFVDSVAVVFSRAYGLSEQGRAVCRVMLPIADLLNHGGDEHGEEATWPAVLARSNVRWEVVDGERLAVRALRVLEAGEEAVFSYREQQGNDQYLLYYGFVPARNAHDDVELFDGLDAALEWAAAEGAQAAAARAAAAAAEAEAGLGDGVVPRLLALTGGRIDNRLVAAFSAALGSRAAAFAALARRAAELRERLAAGEACGQAAVEALVAHKLLVLDDTRATLERALADRAA